MPTLSILVAFILNLVVNHGLRKYNPLFLYSNWLMIKNRGYTAKLFFLSGTFRSFVIQYLRY